MRVIYREEAKIIIGKHLDKTSDQELKRCHDLSQDDLDSIFRRYGEGGIYSFTVKKESRGIHDECNESNSFLRMKL